MALNNSRDFKVTWVFAKEGSTQCNPYNRKGRGQILLNGNCYIEGKQWEEIGKK